MKRNYAIVFGILCLFSLRSSAQESIIGEINYGLLDKYIEAAKEYYPRRKVFTVQSDVAKIGITTNTLSYLDIFSASYFYRPGDKTAISAPGETVNPYIVNGIQYGVSVNLGNFLQKPFMVKRAKAEYKIAKLQEQDYDVYLATEVKKRYYNYIQALSELKIKTQNAQENKTVAENARRRFEKGEISLDNYNAARLLLADSNSEQIQIEVNYLNSKDALEEIIGKKLTEIK